MGTNRKDITGETFGYLTAIQYDHFDGKNSYWKFRCKCGKTVIRSLKKLREAKTPSCGCYAKEIQAEAQAKRKEREEEKQAKKMLARENAKQNRDLSGEKFDKLEVLKLLSEKSGIEAEYLCKCDCGKNVIKKQKTLIRPGTSKSCGCGRKNAAERNASRKRLHRIYNGMIARCHNENHAAYKYYGGRGICVYKLWLEDSGFDRFCNWAIHNGYRDDLSIDRINVNGNYTPSNCRWADTETQANNKTNNVHVFYNGEDMTLAMFSKKINANYKEIRQIIQNDCMFSGEYIKRKLDELS